MPTFKGYSERSKARRALIQVYAVHIDAADHLLQKVEGKWGFYITGDNKPTLMSAEQEAAAVAVLEQHNPKPKSLVDIDADHKVEQAARVQAALERTMQKAATGFDDEVAQAADTVAVADTQDADTDEPSPPSAFGSFAMAQLTAPSNNGNHTPTPAAAPVRSASTKGQKIEKDRPTQNGVQLPSSGTLCRAVWDQLTSMMVPIGDTGQATVPSAQEIKAVGEQRGWNANNVSIEYYRWRKFNGITGRAKKGA